MVSLTKLVLRAVDLDLLGPKFWPAFRLRLGTLALPLTFTIVFPFAFALPLAFSLSFFVALALSWAFRVPSALVPSGIVLIV